MITVIVVTTRHDIVVGEISGNDVVPDTPTVLANARVVSADLNLFEIAMLAAAGPFGLSSDGRFHGNISFVLPEIALDEVETMIRMTDKAATAWKEL